MPPRQFDDAAFDALVEAVTQKGSVTLTLPSAADAGRVRTYFYQWRKRLQTLAITSPADNVVVKVHGPNVTFSASVDSSFRSALQAAGITVREDEEVPNA